MTCRTSRTAVSAIALSLALVAAPALAETSPTNGTAGGMTGGAAAGVAPDRLTCASLTGMDAADVPGALYFVAGYAHGSSQAPDLGAGAGAGMTGAATGTGDSAMTGTDGATRPGADGQGTAALGTVSAGTGSAGTGSAGTVNAGTDSAGTGGMTGTATDMGAGTDMAAGRDPTPSGFFRISISEVMATCAENPDRTIAEVVREHRGMQGG